MLDLCLDREFGGAWLGWSIIIYCPVVRPGWGVLPCGTGGTGSLVLGQLRIQAMWINKNIKLHWYCTCTLGLYLEFSSWLISFLFISFVGVLLLYLLTFLYSS